MVIILQAVTTVLQKFLALEGLDWLSSERFRVLMKYFCVFGTYGVKDCVSTLLQTAESSYSLEVNATTVYGPFHCTHARSLSEDYRPATQRECTQTTNLMTRVAQFPVERAQSEGHNLRLSQVL